MRHDMILDTELREVGDEVCISFAKFPIDQKQGTSGMNHKTFGE